jgi:hypothetical protein
MEGKSKKCVRCYVDRQICRPGVEEREVDTGEVEIVDPAPPSAAAGKRRVIPTVKAAGKKPQVKIESKSSMLFDCVRR